MCLHDLQLPPEYPLLDSQLLAPREHLPARPLHSHLRLDLPLDLPLEYLPRLPQPVNLLLLPLELLPDMQILLLELDVDLLDVDLELLEALVLPLEVRLQLTQLLLPEGLRVLQPCLEVAPHLRQGLLELGDLCLFQGQVLELEVQDVGNVPEHGS